jgi:hypothetical protein
MLVLVGGNQLILPSSACSRRNCTICARPMSEGTVVSKLRIGIVASVVEALGLGRANLLGAVRSKVAKAFAHSVRRGLWQGAQVKPRIHRHDRNWRHAEAGAHNSFALLVGSIPSRQLGAARPSFLEPFPGQFPRRGVHTCGSTHLSEAVAPGPTQAEGADRLILVCLC